MKKRRYSHCVQRLRLPKIQPQVLIGWIWLNQCVQHMIRVEEVYDIGIWGLVNNLGLKTLDAVTIKESK